MRTVKIYENRNLNMTITKTRVYEEDGTYIDLTEKEYEEYIKQYEHKALETKERLEKITNIDIELQKLLALRQQQKETEELIKGLGYKIWKNKPDEQCYSLRSKVFNKMKLRLIDKTPYVPFGSGFFIEEWLIPIEMQNEIEEELDEEYHNGSDEENED